MSSADGCLKTGYAIGALLAGALAFLLGWAYAVQTYGWFLGGGLGWIPAMFIGAIVGALWPVGFVGLLYVLNQSRPEWFVQASVAAGYLFAFAFVVFLFLRLWQWVKTGSDRSATTIVLVLLVICVVVMVVAGIMTER